MSAPRTARDYGLTEALIAQCNRLSGDKVYVRTVKGGTNAIHHALAYHHTGKDRKTSVYRDELGETPWMASELHELWDIDGYIARTGNGPERLKAMLAF